MNLPHVIVVGSANLDYTTSVSRLPVPGETVLADGLRLLPGGKGMNQAVASSRLGAAVKFVGCVGDDSDGTFLLERLHAEAIDARNVVTDTRRRTGIAIISVLPSGDNGIIVVPGANHGLEPAMAAEAVLGAALPDSVIVVQAEIPPTVIGAVAQAAEAVGARLLINLAPYIDLAAETLSLADPLVVNQVEASELCGVEINGSEAAVVAGKLLLTRARSVVVTLGADGAFWAGPGSSGHATAPQINDVVDTTGAGDAFVGALAALLADGTELGTGVQLACHIAGFAVGRSGAQSSYPKRSEAAAIIEAARGLGSAR